MNDSLETKIYKIAVFDSANIEALSKHLADLPENVKVEYTVINESYGKDKQEELVKLMQEGKYDGAVIRSNTWFTEALDKLHGLVLGRAGVGVDNIDISKASKNGTMVLYAPDSNSISVEEEVFDQIGELERKIGYQNARLKSGDADKSVKKDSIGREVYGKIMAIMGIGNIGSKVAAEALGKGMYIAAYDALRSNTEILGAVSSELKKRGLILVDESRVQAVDSLEGILKSGADYYTVHVPINEHTRNLISKEQIGWMNDDAVLINDARAGIVDEEAVFEALNSGKLRAYITDVLTENSPLLNHSKVLVTAHTGASTVEAEENAGTMIGESMVLWAKSGGKEILRSYNYPTIDDNLRDAYNLTRVMAAFATQYVTQSSDGIKSVNVLTSGFPSYNQVALSMAASAGTAFSLGKLNGNSDLPADSIMKEAGINVGATEIEGARPGISSQIILEYELASGKKERFVGQIDTRLRESRKYNLNEISHFTGRGTALYRTQYILVEHPDEPKYMGKVTTAIGEHNFNIAKGQVNLGSEDRPDLNMLVCPVHLKEKLNTPVPETLLADIRTKVEGVGGRVIHINLSGYQSPHAV